jgi:hypothetical protein
MATRKTPPNTRPPESGLVPVLRDAVRVVDHALEQLGRGARPRKNRAAAGKGKRP